MNTVYEQVLEKFKNENINIDNYYILIIGRDYSFNGDKIGSFSISKDKQWVCLPVIDEESTAFFGSYLYKPMCFEIEDEYECYVGSGMLYRAEVYLLNKGE